MCYVGITHYDDNQINNLAVTALNILKYIKGNDLQLLRSL